LQFEPDRTTILWRVLARCRQNQVKFVTKEGAVDNKVSRWSLTALFQNRQKPVEPPVRAHRAPSPYHAVSVVPGLFVCAESKKIVGVRFLSKEAPTLPFKNCDSEQCRCRYQHHTDRRQGDRRHRDLWNSDRQWPGHERREQQRGRRSTDAR
jgi:hypothetical protein